ncbi:MAG: 50S ribosomal protein P1 [Thaumarchaeota archaeon]|jgi:large subunit ribosomal protein L12|nr:50S ribosomal protein P1 [Nitrososphaerota archaeon]
MEYIYAALLLHRLQQPITEENVKKVIAAAGVTPNEVKVKALVSALSEINIDEAIKNATLTPIAAPTTAAPAAPTQAPAAAPAKEEKKEEEEKKGEEEALAGLAALFG